MKFHARVRLTSRYVDEYAHLDQWGEGFDFEVVNQSSVKGGNGFDDLGAVRWTIQGDASKPADLQIAALRSTLNQSGCSHEYDCCGCYSQSAYEVRQMARPGLFTALISTSRNY